ncbi:MAG TPA: DUF255 domain-containing protein [Geothrix sp.]
MHRTATCLLLGWLWVVQGFAQGSIAWKEWGQGPFAEAKRLGRPVLVDAEATWCHWCHVMEAKTYGDPEVVVGDPQDARTRALVEAGRSAWIPGVVLLRHDPARATPLNPELSFPVLAEPAAFLCGKGTCSAPLKTPEALTKEARRRL